MARHTYRHIRAGVQHPAPQSRPGAAPTVQSRPMFVVQEHHARRLHYDFRLEVDGVLKSWVVPKGPSTDPTQKRLAVQVADHPLAYATFAGTIPEGQYGAGTVTIWDQGTYDNVLAERRVPQTVPEGMTAGHLELVLYGTKLQGQFALIRLHGTGRGPYQWLLIKRHEAWAQSENAGDIPVRGHSRPHAGSSQARTPSGARPPVHARRRARRSCSVQKHVSRRRCQGGPHTRGRFPPEP